MTRIALIALSLTLASALPATADEGSDFIAKLNGRWSGSGTIRTSAGDAPGATRCSLNASGSGTSITISGSCDGAARGANLAVQLRWVAATKQFTGSFSGAAEQGTASLYGRLTGSSLALNVTSANGGRSSMSLSLAGASARLAVSGRDGSGKSMQFVSLSLRKG